MKRHIIYLLITTLYFFLLSPTCFGESHKIINVEVEGNHKVSTEKILTNINSKVGDVFDTSIAAADAKRIARLSYVKGCSARTKNVDGGVLLTFTIKEVDLIKSISFTGNSSIDTGMLKKQLSFKEGGRLSITKPAKDKRTIANVYKKKGYLDVKVKLDREQLLAGDIVYTILEGATSSIEKITEKTTCRKKLANSDDDIDTECFIAKIGDHTYWSRWRSAPLNFPTYMDPVVPETLEGGPAIEFGDEGEDLTIILPDFDELDPHEESLWNLAYRIRLPEAIVTDITDLTDNLLKRHLIIYGTIKNNPLVGRLLDSKAEKFMEGITPCGYHIKVIDNPWAKDKKIVLALGKDKVGAWQAATILHFAIHEKKTHVGKLGKLLRWPVDLPEGYFLAPFEAKHTGSSDLDTVADSSEPFEHPKVPFGVRCWGSPTPTVNTFKRMIDSLKPFGVNSIVIQPGGWPDIENSGEVSKAILDCAYESGVSIRLYIGNELRSHYPAPLTRNHKDMAIAVKCHPALAAWRLYNQLEDDMTPEEYKMVKEQIEWLKGISDKPIGMEVAWGHDTGPIPGGKRKLINQLREWGVDEIAHDYAPIGGWSKNHDLSLWEDRLKDIDKPFAVLQAHIPFTEPTVPSAEELRNQYWWCVAGGARAFYFEAAYVFAHFSNRGLLSWNLEPLPDGRIQEMGKLANVTKNIEDMIVNSQDAKGDEIEKLNFTMSDNKQVAVRFRTGLDGIIYLILINRDLTSSVQLKFTIGRNGYKYKILSLTSDKKEETITKPQTLKCTMSAGGGVCYQIKACD